MEGAGIRVMFSLAVAVAIGVVEDEGRGGRAQIYLVEVEVWAGAAPSTFSKGAGIFPSRGSTPQMSRAYSRMVRSEENFHAPEILARTIRAHLISS